VLEHANGGERDFGIEVVHETGVKKLDDHLEIRAVG
jgi:hypothetical protein